jgi:hypothetical protein
MAVHISIPFLIATVLFFLMYIPALLVGDSSVNVDSSAETGDAAESESLLHNADPVAPDEDAAPEQSASPTNVFRTRFAVFAAGSGPIFLFSLAKDSMNYLTPWVSLRFDETMARVRLSHWLLDH